MATASTSGASDRAVPTVWGDVPQRNRSFTGRESLLETLHESVTSQVTAVLAHALHGMGGVGKTHLAIEYIYRHMRDYDLVWWISADQVPLIRSSLAALAPRLGLDEKTLGGTEDVIATVLDSLRRGEPHARWLLVFDNADQPEHLATYLQALLPSADGHVIVTSRNHRWESRADVVEVDVFTRDESLAFLEKRAPSVKPDESTRLAEELGDLPLALEQAAALQVEAGITADEYLELLANESRRILTEHQSSDYEVSPVAAVWSLSMAQLKERTPFAWELLRRCAFFGPEPIRRDLLRQGRFVLDEPMRSGLGDPIVLGRAYRELGRYALARVDNNRKTLQVHRLIQRLIRDDMAAEEARKMRHEVHLLLAATDPEDPDDLANWPRYEELIAHGSPSKVGECRNSEVRQLTRNLVRYLYLVGDVQTGDALAEEALVQWKEDSGDDDEDVLILSGQRASLLWTAGDWQKAHELRVDTLDRMRRVLGEEHEETILMRNGHGADLRVRGEFAEALALDDETLTLSSAVFGDDHQNTFMVANNVAIDQGLTSDYKNALATDNRTHRDRLDHFQRDDNPLVIHSLGAIGRDHRQAGQYREALAIERQAYEAFRTIVRNRTVAPDHNLVLAQARNYSVALRKMGDLRQALDLAEEVTVSYDASSLYGERHPDRLVAAMTLGNARRVYGDVNGDQALMDKANAEIESTFAVYRDVYGDDHPFSHGCALNLAIVLRRVGAEAQARDLLQEALAGLVRRLEEGHHYTLTCRAAFATLLAETGDVEAARTEGERALQGLSDVVGADHPHTLACASNLAIDVAELGDTARSEELTADTIKRYEGILPPTHLDVLDAKARKRIALDFEPVPL